MKLHVLETIQKQKLFVGSTVGVGMFRGVIVIGHGHAPPTAEDWTQLCRILDLYKDCTRAHLVLSLGGVPNPMQRKAALDQYPKGHVMAPSAMMPNHDANRAVASAINWLKGDTSRAFAEADLAGVCMHLHVSYPEAEALVAFAHELLPLHEPLPVHGARAHH